jgi:hypothetical protein
VSLAPLPAWNLTLRLGQNAKSRNEHMSAGLPPKSAGSLWIAEDFWVLRFRLIVNEVREHGLKHQRRSAAWPFCWTGFGQGDEHLHCG